MNVILIKMFATALALSQVTTQPDQIKTQFDPTADREAVSQLLRDGCAQMRKAFDIEDINLDDLIATAMDDPKALAGDIKAFKGVNFNDLHIAYRQFCKNETVADSPVDLGEVIAFYNKAAGEMPSDARLKNLRRAGGYLVLDGKGGRYAEIFEGDQRRSWVPLADIPETMQKAFVTAEDKRFYQHKGVDERGLIRAFITNLAQPGRPQGGSTITQQVAKNLLVGDDITYERKIREMIVASRIESVLSKAEILELYLNSIYLGRNSWGVEMASRSYFGKPAKALDLGEAALLAGLTKGPNFFNPERHPDRARERLGYVLGRMKAEGVLSADEAKDAQGRLPHLVAYERPRRNNGYHFMDQIAREARATGVESLTAGGYEVRSTIRPELQLAAETALQDGLARYEANAGRARFKGSETNLGEAIRRIDADKALGSGKPAWQQALQTARLPLYDVHWTPAVVVVEGKTDLRVGLADGRVLPLAIGKSGARKNIDLHDVVYVRVSDKGKGGRAELRIRPEVQGAAVVLDNSTGAILAVVGGFSYPLSQLNRATQAQRQPGSTLKPFSFLAALRKGLQPNTVVRDMPITLPPIGSGVTTSSIIAYPDRRDQQKDYWTPKNYSGGGGGITTLRRALENSKNLVTANLLDGAIDSYPEASLERVCELTQEAQVYKDCIKFYPFVLGAQPARLVDLAAFYAAVASEGARPLPHAIESIEQDGRTVYRAPNAPIWLGSADRVAFYQLKSMLQGVVSRGTASAMRGLAPFVGGKTGTSDDENDAWFIGFTNEVTVGVWVGYDNARGKRRTLGGGQTGGKVAIPIFEPIMQAVWAHYTPKTPLAPPSALAKRQLATVPIELASGMPLPAGTPSAFVEYLRRDASGHVSDTQYNLVSREEAYSIRSYAAGGDGDLFGMPGGPFASTYPPGVYVPGSVYQQEPRRGLFNGLFGDQRWQNRQDAPQRHERRIDPDYYWGTHNVN